MDTDRKTDIDKEAIIIYSDAHTVLFIQKDTLIQDPLIHLGKTPGPVGVTTAASTTTTNRDADMTIKLDVRIATGMVIKVGCALRLVTTR